MRHHWYKPGFWLWWWNTRSRDARALTMIGAVALFGAGGYFAVDAFPNTGWTSGREVVTMTRIVHGKVVYQTIAGRVETFPSRTDYATVTQPSGIVTVAARGKPATTEIVTVAARGKPATTEIVTVAARGKPVTTEITRTVTVDQRQHGRHLVTHQRTVTVQQTVTAGIRMVTNESTVTQPVTEVSTTTSTVAVTTIVPATTTVSVTTTLPGSTVTRTVTETTPGPTMTVVVSPTTTVTIPLLGG